MSNRKIINTVNAPQAIGPYSQAIKINNLLFTSGQIPLLPDSGEIVSNDLKQLIYVYDFLRLWTFYIQVIEEAQIIDTQNYPKLIFSHGNITESRLNKEL